MTLFPLRNDGGSKGTWEICQTGMGHREEFLGYASSGFLQVSMVEWRTSTFFALQIRHARFRTLPSARTTSGANSMPNLFDSASD